MIALGIDVGPTTSGVALVDVSKPRARLLFGANLAWREAAFVAIVMAPALVALEVPEDVYQAVYRRDPGAARSMARAIGAAKGEAGKIEGALLGRVLTVSTSARVWRKALCGSATASDAQVARSLAMRADFGRTNSHVRDALGVAVWAAAKQRMVA